MTTMSVSTVVTPETTTLSNPTTTGLATSTRFPQTTSKPVTTKPTTSTQAVTEKPKAPITRCNITTESRSITDEFGCSNTQPIQQTACQGFCNSTAVTNITSPWVDFECFCCKPKNFRVASVSLRCPDGGTKVFKYLIITECSCESCNSHAYETRLRTVVGSLFGNTTKLTNGNVLT